MNNPNRFAQLTTLSSPLEIEDSVDFPHTGLIKALSSANTGKYPINGFNITSITNNTFIVASGNIFKDNALQAVAGRTFNGGGGNGPVIPGTYSLGYHLLVVDSSNVLQHRNPTAANKVATYQDGDTIIAVIAFETGQNLKIQYLTNFKTSNSLSIGYDNSGYTEAMSVEGNATRTTFHNKIADADVRFVLGDNTADERFEIVTDDDADGDLTDTLTEVFSVDGTGDTKVKSLSLGSAAELTITESSDDITIKNTVSDKDIKFNVNEGGTPVDAMTIDGSDNRVKVGKFEVSGTNPSHAVLDITNTNAGVTIKNTKQNNPIKFQTNVGGSSVTQMSIGSQGGAVEGVAIGPNPPTAPLHVQKDFTGELVVIDSFTNSADHGPNMVLRRSGGSGAGGIGADNDGLGTIVFQGRDASSSFGQNSEYASIEADIKNATNNAHNGSLKLTIAKANSKVSALEMNSSEIVVNEDSVDIDFRVESDGNANMLVVNSGLNRVGIGTASPTETLDVVGSITASTSIVSGGFFRSPRLDTIPSNNTSLTLTAATHAGRYLIYSGSGGTITLPATSSAGEHYTILNATTGNITVAHGGNAINGAGSNITVGTFNGVTCIAIGSNNWIALGV
tara:strand:- start:11277 stop:13139 length:1863 start_codon:yes stop_codon:yes gene_type:complete